MSEIKFVDFERVRNSGGKASDQNHITIAPKASGKRGNTYMINLNLKLTNFITSKGCEFVRVGLNELTGQKYLVFTKDKGYPINYPTDKRKTVAIYSKQMLEFLRNTLGMKDDERKVWVSDDLSNTESVVTIEIKRA